MNNSRYNPLPTPKWLQKAIERTLNGEIFLVPYNEILSEATEYRRMLLNQGITIGAPQQDPIRFTLALIDPQITFCHSLGELKVEGAVEDSIRTAEFIVKYVHMITQIALTMDTHTVFQIFHPAFWVDSQGNHPRPFTQITFEDIRKGVWVVNPAVISALDVTPQDIMGWVLYYCQTLEATGKYKLMVWPFHGMLGGVAHAVMPIIEAAYIWWSVLRGANVYKEIKGTNPITEMYSAIMAEVNTDVNGVVVAPAQIGFIRVVADSDVVGVAGQAKTHCVWATAIDLDNMLNDPANNAQHLIGKLRFFWDLSSPVGGFEDMLPKIEADLVQRGYRIVNSTDSIEAILH